MEGLRFDSGRCWICLFTLMCGLSLGYSRYQEEGSPDSIEFGQLFSKCVRFTPEFDSCVKDALNNAQDFFLTGVPELNLPSMDPWNLADVHLNRTSHDLKFMNTRESSWRKSIIEEFKSNLSPNLPYVQFTQFLPEYFIEGDFKALGKQIEGFQEGKWNLTLYNMTRTLAISRNQQDPAKFKVKQSIHEIENMKVFLGDLPDSTPSSEHFDNLVLNSFWKAMLPVVKPMLEDLLDVAYSKKYSELFGNLDWNRVFPLAPKISS